MREEASFRIIFEKFRASKWKLEIDDPKASKKKKRLWQRRGSCRICFYSWSTTTNILSQQKYYIETLQAMETLLLKALREEDFGHEL